MKLSRKQCQIFFLLFVFGCVGILTFKAPLLNEDFTKISVNRHLQRTDLKQYVASTEARTEKSYYRPVNNAVTWVLNRAFGNQSALPFRMAGVACLLFAGYCIGNLTNLLFKTTLGSWASILFFLSHPINSWYYFQGSWVGNTLSIAFGSLWASSIIQMVRRKELSFPRLLLTSLFIFTALLSKESIILLVFVLVPYMIHKKCTKLEITKLSLTVFVPLGMYLSIRILVLGDAWKNPIANFSESLYRSADILIQHLTVWISGSNFSYGKAIPHLAGLWADIGMAVLFLGVPLTLYFKKKFALAWFFWAVVITLMEPVIGFHITPAVVSTRLTLFTAVISVGAGMMIHFVFFNKNMTPKMVKNSLLERLREICFPTFVLMLLWYGFQTGFHVMKSTNVDHFYQYHLQNPEGWKLLYSYAEYLQRDGRINEAEPFIKESARLNPVSFTMNALGVSRVKMEKPEEGLDIFLNILESDPNNVSALNNAGSSFNILGDKISAAIYFARAYELDPEYMEVGANLLATYLSASPDERMSMIEVIKNTRQPEILNQIGLHLAAKGDFVNAISHFNYALLLNPGSSRTYSLIAKAYAELGNLDQSIQYFEKSIGLNPNNARSLNDWGILEAKRGNLSKARELFERAVQSDSKFTEARENLNRATLQIQRDK